MARPGTLEVCRKYLYENIDQIPDAYRDRIRRVRFGYTHWYEYPATSRSRIRDLIVNEFHVTGKTAYEDIQAVEILLGNIKNPEKAWIRYRVNTFLEEAYRLAKLQKDPKAMAIAADKMGKYNQLDKPDAEPIPFDQIVPQNFEPTDDPTPLGLKKDPEIRKKKKKMLEKYLADIEITDVAYEELKQDDEGEKEDLLQ
jgi:hypothetical protein